MRTSRTGSYCGGYTLIEILVVLILMGIAAALVVPSVLPPDREDAPSFRALVQTARQSAVRRGEVVYLSITSAGDWRLDGAASQDTGPFVTGRLTPYGGPKATLVVSPLGSCSFDLISAEARLSVPLEPLTCEVLTQ